MQELNERIVKRLDALLGLALTRLSNETEKSLTEHVCYLRNFDFSNKEIAAILGKTVHHIEVEASKLARQGKIKKQRGK
ncbi:MAG: hypothetical protein IH847_07990 [Acidobacteria bacterium]|nr:hypothetical protein [Acidobacteriota bacterium]